MNCGYSIVAIFVAITTTNVSMCSMYKVVKALTVYGLPAIGASTAYQAHMDKYFSPEDDAKPAKKKTTMWAQNTMKECNVTPVPLLCDSTFPTSAWVATNKRVIKTSVDDVDTVERILEKEPGQRSSEDNNTIALKKMFLMHELAHIHYKDTTKNTLALFAVPTAIQGIASGTAYGFNKMFKVQPPKTPGSAVVRCAFLITALGLKKKIQDSCFAVYSQEIESRADEFACTMALKSETGTELQQFADFWRKREAKIVEKPGFDAIKDDPSLVRAAYFRYIDPTHPYPGDRAIMAERFFEKYKLEHSNE